MADSRYRKLVLACLIAAGLAPRWAGAAARDGVLELGVFDQRDGRSPAVVHSHLVAQDGIYELFGELPEGLNSGAEVSVQGVVEGDGIRLSSPRDIIVRRDRRPAKPADMETAAILLIKFKGGPQPSGSAQALSEGLDRFLNEVSRGRTRLRGDVYGWYTLDREDTCDPNAIADEVAPAALAALQADARLTAYKRFILLAASNCDWGYGTVGERTFSVSGPDGGEATTLRATSLWLPCLDGSCAGWLAHEFGHNLGLPHAHGLNCPGRIGARDCALDDYGDAADTMGGGYWTGRGSPQYNAHYKLRLGWLDSEETATIVKPGTYAFQLTPAASRGLKAIYIPMTLPNGEPGRYVAEFRERRGLDRDIPIEGLQLRLLKGDRETADASATNLLAISPGRGEGEPYEFRDRNSQLRVLAFPGETGGARVIVQFGPQADAVPAAASAKKSAPSNAAPTPPRANSNPDPLSGRGGGPAAAAPSAAATASPALAPSLPSLVKVIPPAAAAAVAEPKKKSWWGKVRDLGKKIVDKAVGAGKAVVGAVAKLWNNDEPQTAQAALRGVNLGGWLVLEKWMTPSLFDGTEAKDEYSLMKTAGAADKLEKHHKTFIVESDFQWLQRNGVNAVRIPVGYWILGDEPPYLGGLQYLDWAFAMAKKYQLQVLLDLHGAPGSQNGKDHSGRIGDAEWYEQSADRERTKAVLESLLDRYAKKDELWGIELMNEPMTGYSLSRQWQLYWWTRNTVKSLSKAYPGRFKFVFSDAFAPWLWTGRIKDSRAVMDVHHYQIFSASDRKKTMEQHEKAAAAMAKTIAGWQKDQPTLIGEWSLALDGGSLGVPGSEAEPRFARAQLDAYTRAAGWFFWSYKTEHPGGWNFRHLVDSGVMKLK